MAAITLPAGLDRAWGRTYHLPVRSVPGKRDAGGSVFDHRALIVGGDVLDEERMEKSDPRPDSGWRDHRSESRQTARHRPTWN
jgi:hypothetical protein